VSRAPGFVERANAATDGGDARVFSQRDATRYEVRRKQAPAYRAVTSNE